MDYRPQRTITPLTAWVHRGLDGSVWLATTHIPPMPALIEGKGYPLWVVYHRGRELYFASPEEIDHAIDVLGRRILPSPRELGRAYLAVNSHWLSRLHASWKPWKVRQELVRRLQRALAP